MNIEESPIPEFEQEMATTRRLLERVPDDRGDWKPHPRSFSMAHLAQLVSRMPGWLVNITRETSLDLAGGAHYSNERTTTLLSGFDRSVDEARAALTAAAPSDLEVKWSLTMGDRVLMSLPRREVLRQTLNHLIHHRGQLSVYLRLVEVPVPSIYGPTADERW